ncbi:MAG: NYN domain-containing protein [Planctomycetota bacterium]
MLLVDTYNVLHTPAALRSVHDDPTPGHLAVLIAASRFRRDRALLVCDGSPHPEHLGPSAERTAECRYRVEGVEIVYAGAGRDADSLIELLIDRDTAKRRLRVVSSDRRLIRAARAVRARSIDANGFVETLLDDAQRAGRRWTRPAFTTEVPLSAHAVRYWSDLFGIAADDLDTPPTAERIASTPSAPRPTTSKPAQSPERTRPERRTSPTDGTTPHQSVQPKAQSSARPKPRPSPRPAPALNHRPAPSPDQDPIDPVLLEALEEWRDRLSLDDLNMEQWIGDDASRDGLPSRSRRRTPRPGR